MHSLYSSSNPEQSSISPTDADLLRAFAEDGREDHLLLLLSRYETALYGYSLKLMRGNEEAARDLYQETVYRLLIKIRSEPQPGSINALLFLIANGLAVDYFRRSKQESAYASELSRELKLKHGYFASQNKPIPEPDDRDWLKRGLQTLDGLQAEASRQFFLEGASYREIVADTGEPLSRVKSALQHGKRKLRTWLLRQYRKENR
ncbi:hypothetical protein CEQ90_14795 [Lewinellaceae bacterium SD302]|nr:hypothetical protein CEQ90_14795 [Lewinellaceae bacterium SD302]